MQQSYPHHHLHLHHVYVDNKARYGMNPPEAYPLNQLTEVPIAIFSGARDDLADPADVVNTISSLPDGAVIFDKQLPNYDHIVSVCVCMYVALGKRCRRAVELYFRLCVCIGIGFSLGS